MEINGKVALVLGAIKGIGKQIGLSLAQKGVKVALTYFDWEESLVSMQNDFLATGTDHLIININLRDTNSIGSLIDKVVSHFGRLDILINNIERGGWPIVHGPYTESQWDLELETTLRAKRWVFDASLPHLKDTGDGVVINISSIAGIVGRSGPACYIFNDGYAAANRAIGSLTETWARISAPQVRVNEIMIGFFETRHANHTRGWGLLSDRQKKTLINHILLKRIGKLDDIVKAIHFIIQDATYMTGSILKIDGGYTLGGEEVAPMPDGIL